MNKELLLHIETSAKMCSVSLSSNRIIIDCIEEIEDKYIHSEKLTVFIQEILRNNNLKLNDLMAMSISIGPGSYTGLRIGLSTAKALSFAGNIPLIPLNSLEILLQCENQFEKNRIALIDARRMEVYALGKNQKQEIIVELNPYIIDENSFENLEPFIAIGDAIKKLKEVWRKRKNIEYSSVEHISSKYQSSLAYDSIQSGKKYSLSEINPEYIKSFKIQH